VLVLRNAKEQTKLHNHSHYSHIVASDLKSMGAKSNDADTELPGIVNREDRM